jgi:AbiTii
VSLIAEIQKAAVEKDTDLATLLRKCKVLAAHLGSVPLEDWVLHESNGYPAGANLPGYRVWGVQIVAHLIDEFGAQMPSVMVAPNMIPEALRTRFTRFEYRESVATAEYVLRNGDEDMQTFSTGNLRSMLHGKVYKGFQCHSAVAQFSNQHLVAMLDAVRNRILDFALALGKIAPDAGEDQSQVEVQRVTQIFNTTIHGSVGVVGTATNSVVNVTANNWVALAQFLASQGVEQPDIDQLHDAVVAEPKAEAGKWGPHVSKWIGKMVGKAADGSWHIGLGAAGNLLAQALTAYYGLP